VSNSRSKVRACRGPADDESFLQHSVNYVVIVNRLNEKSIFVIGRLVRRARYPFERSVAIVEPRRKRMLRSQSDHEGENIEWQ
jgi:hypothetical protein